MSDTLCNRSELIAGAAPFACFNDHEILALTIMLKAEIAHAANPDIPTDVASLEIAAEGLTTNAGFYKRRRMDARLYLRCLEAVDAGAESDCGNVSALWSKAKCFSCKSDDELEAIRLYLTCAMQIPVAPPFPEGATHYWRLNEASGDSTDEIGGLTLVNDGATQHIAGPLDFGVQINGSGSAALLASSESIPSIRVGDWSLNVWQKAIGTLDGYTVVGQLNDFTNAGEDTFFAMDAAPPKATVQLGDGSAKTSTTLDFPDSAFDGEWHMVTITFEGGVVSFYLDGVFVNSGTNTRGANSTSTPIYVGERGGSDTGTDQGVADLGIWPRALSQEEITTLYNGGVPLRP